MANNYNLSISQGDTFATLLSLTNSDGSILDLTDYVASGQARYSYSSTGVLLTLKPTIYSAVSGIIRLVISGSESASLPCSVVPYDIEIFNTGDSTTLKPIRGYMEIGVEVTR